MERKLVKFLKTNFVSNGVELMYISWNIEPKFWWNISWWFLGKLVVVEGWCDLMSNNLQRLHRRGKLQFYAFYCSANGCSTDHKCNKLRKSAGKKSNLSILCRPSAILELCTFMIITSNGKIHIKHINEDLTHISTLISLPYKQMCS